MLLTTSKKLRTLIEIPLYAVAIVVLENLFLALPNISLTPLMFAVYFKTRPYGVSFYVVFVYMSLQVLQWGVGLWVLPMFIGWLLWLIIVKRLKWMPIEIKGIVFAVLYGLTFLPLTVIVYGIDPWAYIVADIPFQINMAIGNTITLALLFKRLTKLMKREKDNVTFNY